MAQTKEEKSAYRKLYYKKNRKRLRAKQAEYCAKHKLEIAAKQKANYDSKRDEKLAKKKIYTDAHKREKQLYDSLRKTVKRAQWVKRKYGLEWEDYVALVEKQNGSCAICGQIKPLCVDHNHTTGKVRGLLCRKCNAALGGFKDDPRLLRDAANYLDQHQDINL